MKLYLRLHLGCGHRIMDGWLNIDMAGGPGVVIHDLSTPLPYEDATIDEIYSEHFIEHLTREDTYKMLQECRRVMMPGTKIRISTPDLTELVKCYMEQNVERYKSVGWLPLTPCQMVNEALRRWGHQFIYDEAELVQLLQECGFTDVKRVTIDAEYECRPDNNDLVVTARK